MIQSVVHESDTPVPRVFGPRQQTSKKTAKNKSTLHKMPQHTPSIMHHFRDGVLASVVVSLLLLSLQCTFVTCASQTVTVNASVQRINYTVENTGLCEYWSRMCTICQQHTWFNTRTTARHHVHLYTRKHNTKLMCILFPFSLTASSGGLTATCSGFVFACKYTHSLTHPLIHSPTPSM